MCMCVYRLQEHCKECLTRPYAVGQSRYDDNTTIGCPVSGCTKRFSQLESTWMLPYHQFTEHPSPIPGEKEEDETNEYLFFAVSSLS